MNEEKLELIPETPFTEEDETLDEDDQPLDPVAVQGISESLCCEDDVIFNTAADDDAVPVTADVSADQTGVPANCTVGYGAAFMREFLAYRTSGGSVKDQPEY